MSLTEITHTNAKMRENRVLQLRGESFSPVEFVQNAALSFKESLLGLKNYFVVIDGFKGENKSLGKLRSTISDAKDLGGFNYISNARLLVPCPVGFQGDYLEYTSALNSNFDEVFKVTQNELNMFTAELSKFISSKDVKISIKDNGNSVKAMRAWRLEKEKAILQFFGNGTNERVHLGNIFANRDSIVPAAVQSADAYAKALAANPRKIKGSVDEVVMRIESVINMATSGESLEVTQEALRNIAEKCYEVGRLVELLAIYSTQAETAGVISSHILDRVIPLSK